ncbi:hypothetical protein [Rhodococcus opacus]|uniref:hypothetical protein n=1 Tax=Rhodococcus opacus TaxID=37919 RepID=UPI00155ABB36|nr:hypothetical protein [Rhodococcus opacus]
MATAIGAISAAVIALMLVVGGVEAALLHLVWGPADPARSEKVVGDFLDVVPEAGTTLLVTLLLTGGAIGGLHLVDRHLGKHQPARITGAQLERAPDELRQLMSDAVLAVEEIKGSRAFRDGMFTDLDLRSSMWDLGTRGLAATELHEAITAAAGTDREVLTSDDHQVYTRARTQIEQAVLALHDAADTLADLDTELAAEDMARAEDERGRMLKESSPVSIAWPMSTPPSRQRQRRPRPRSPTSPRRSAPEPTHTVISGSRDARRFGSAPAKPGPWSAAARGTRGHVVMAVQERIWLHCSR